MPRPELTAEYLEKLEEHYQSWLDDPPEDVKKSMMPRSIMESASFKEVFMAGDWLADRLHDSGATEQEIESICFANGQRCFGAPDPWEVAKTSLRRYWEGRADKPGMKLAEEICSEVLGGDMKEMLDQRQQRRNKLYAKYSKFVD